MTKIHLIALSALGHFVVLPAPYGRKRTYARWIGGAIAVLISVIFVSQRLLDGIPLPRLHSRNLWEPVGYASFLMLGLAVALFTHRLNVITQEGARTKRSEARLLAATNSGTDAILMFDCIRTIDDEILDFKFVFLNQNAERMIGIDRENLSANDLHEILPMLRDPECFELYRRVVHTGESGFLEISHPLFKTCSGSGRYHVKVVRYDDGVALSLTDISVQANYQEELKKALSFNKSVVACSPFSIIVTDQDGLINSVNSAAERLLCYEESDLLGQPYTEIHDPDEIIQRAEELSFQLGSEVSPDHHVFQVAQETGLIGEREWTYIRKDGSRVPVQLATSALRDADDSIIGFLGVSYDLTEKRRADEYTHHLANHDPLTGLPSRALLRGRLEAAIEHARRSQNPLALVMIDLDNFKRVNDSLGHQAGDTVLCEISNRLKSCVRKSDAVARMGGDEFVVLLADLRSVTDAVEVCQKVLDCIAQPVLLGRQEIIVTASIGIGFFPDCDDIDALFRNADLAMYEVKARGRNGYQIYTPQLAMQGLEQLQLESGLRHAVDANEFEIVYQPQISFKDGKMLGVEALLRWNSHAFGAVMPNVFIPIAEDTGLIVSIGEWILVEACKGVAALQHRLGVECSVAVNISPRQFQQNDFPATVERALLASGLKPEQLELEITEQLLMVDSEESLGIMQRVRTLGVRFAIDDFGTGFSNMGYITRFAVDRIKIDQSFISRCDVDGTSRAVTSAIIALAHSLDIEVIAEGVESAQQMQMLTEMSCDQAQGFFYSRPLSLDDLNTFAFSSASKHVPASITNAHHAMHNPLSAMLPSMLKS